MPATSPPRFAAIPLAEAPEVQVFLGELGLGALREDRVSTPNGRNDIWAGVTDTGAPVFVKRLVGEAADVRRRLRRIQTMAELLREHATLPTPRCLAVQESTGLAVFELLEDAVSAAELLDVSGFDDELAYEAGGLVGTLHGLAVPEPIANDDSEPRVPAPVGLAAVPLAAYAAASGAQVEYWQILHNDPPLVDAIRHLRRQPASHRTLVHGDLRLDQLMRHDGRLHLTDWEECRVADPARDVGAFAGECLVRGVRGMSDTGRDEDSLPDDGDVIAGAVAAFELLRPLVAAFWDGYRRARPAAGEDPDLPVRAVGFAGWHLFDRIWAPSYRSHQLSPPQRAIAGVGRVALTAADKLTATLGLGATT